jgi:hypothetical protein
MHICVVDADVPDTHPAVFLMAIIVEAQVESLVVGHLVVVPLMDVGFLHPMHVDILLLR